MGTEYNLNFSYKNNFVPSANNNMWQLAAGTDMNLLSLDENSFYVENIDTSENKVIVLNFLDYDGIYSISLIIKKPYYADYNFNPITYQVDLIFKNSYGSTISEDKVGFEKMEINFGGLEKLVYFSTCNIIEMPVLDAEVNLSVKVWLNKDVNIYDSTLKTILVNNPYLSLASFTGAGSNQRIILHGAANNKVININNNVKAVFIKSPGTYENLRFDINLSNDCFLYLNGISIKAPSISEPIIKSTAPNLNISLNGSNNIEGKIPSNRYLIEAQNISFIGDGSLSVIGADGNNGQNGNSSSRNGSNGEKGTNSLSCISYSIQGGNVTVRGGNGIDGANAAINPLYYGVNGITHTLSDAVAGGRGGNGGKGGNGYNGMDNEASFWQGCAGASGGNGGTGGVSTKGARGHNGGNGSKGNDGTNGTEPACIAEGTLITLADGSQIPVETLTGNEQLLVWNLLTGQFDFAPIIFNDSESSQEYEVINLYFSDGTSVKVISEHAFWSISQNKYVFLRNDASQYIGDWFNKQTIDANGNMMWISVQLINVVIANENTTAWSPVTAEHLCYYVNGMLSVPGATEGLINIFDVNPDTIKIDETKYLADIETYGLFTYEEFAEVFAISEEIFDAFGVQYFKVAIGKGILTLEMVENLVEKYTPFF